MSLPSNARTAVVTGASSGIGRAIVADLAGAGWLVFAGVRKPADSDGLRSEFGDAVHPLQFDVTDAAALACAAADVGRRLGGRTLDALVNNAGVAVAGPIRYLRPEDLQRQLDTNLFGVLGVTQAFLPMLGADRGLAGPPGRIVNISSVAGKIAAPFMGPYSISKHALEALSDTMRREFSVHGVGVVVIGPGTIQTPIWGKADDIDLARYRGTEYEAQLAQLKATMQAQGARGLPAARVGALVRKVLEMRAPRSRYCVLRGRLLNWTLPNLLPVALLDKAIAKRFGVRPRSARSGGQG